jgi:DinB superfamily
VSQVPYLLQMFDDNWSHKCESLHSVLHDVTSEESLWRDPAYASEPRIAGLPEPGTIRWQVAHLEHCARHYTQILRDRPVVHEPPTPPLGTADLPELIHRLEEARRLLREEIERLSEVDLDSPCARGMSVAEFVRMAIRHEAWHAGQLVILRRLYRQRRS